MRLPQSKYTQGAKPLTDARRKKLRRERDRYQALAKFDANARLSGGAYIAGVDEVGMGTLAGPVVAAAVILSEEGPFLGIDDSKKVPAARRERLAVAIEEHAIAYALGAATVLEIGELGIFHAGRLAMRRAVMALPVTPTLILVDARTLEDLAISQRALIGGDRKSLAVAAASILAKVSRDKEMVALDVAYPGYGFATHKGYGTRVHLEALERLGACPHHRRQFAPVARALAAQGLS